MSTEKPSKLNWLLSFQPRNIVLLSSWLKNQGYSLELVRNYKKSGWLKPIGQGAFVRSGETIDVFGAIYALQTQKGVDVHIGGRNAFSLLGRAHYLELERVSTTFFASKDMDIPKWLKQYDWGIKINYHFTNFLDPWIGLVDFEIHGFSVKISNVVRALLECLYLTPHHQNLMECYELMESLNNCQPKEVQKLLENCRSIKVKRLFLFLAEKIQHAWFEHLNLSSIDLGKGKRSILKNGIFDKKYQITVPKEWIE